MLTNRLFCYGTLQIPEVIQTVTGRVYLGVTARLLDFAIYRVKNARYPGIVYSPDKETTGILYSGVTEEELIILDLFEGDLYERICLDVIGPKRKIQKAWVYVVPETKKEKLTNEPWHLKAFLEKDFEAFMRNFVNGRKEIFAKIRGK